MSIVRRIARPLLATGYVANGVESFRNSSQAAQHLAPAQREIHAVDSFHRTLTAAEKARAESPAQGEMHLQVTDVEQRLRLRRQAKSPPVARVPARRW